jgi:hypothetical protein
VLRLLSIQTRSSAALPGCWSVPGQTGLSPLMEQPDSGWLAQTQQVQQVLEHLAQEGVDPPVQVLPPHQRTVAAHPDVVPHRASSPSLMHQAQSAESARVLLGVAGPTGLCQAQMSLAAFQVGSVRCRQDAAGRERHRRVLALQADFRDVKQVRQALILRDRTANYRDLTADHHQDRRRPHPRLLHRHRLHRQAVG